MSGQIPTFIKLTLIALIVSSCGRAIESDKLSLLKPGMSREQVEAIIGTQKWQAFDAPAAGRMDFEFKGVRTWLVFNEQGLQEICSHLWQPSHCKPVGKEVP